MASPESPSVMAFSGMTRSPSKDTSVHNHPYAIKTTSTAILSRSNSISGRSSTPLDRVYPPSPSPNAKPLGRSQSRGHGRANSLSSIAPPALPLPAKRRDSQGSVGNAVPPTPQPEAIAQLPDNPKHWSPSQLSTYLSSALRFRGGAAIPARVAKDIAAFTLKEKLTGKAFLRLNDEHLTAMGINQLWKDSLLAASRTLRKKVLKGRIWGFGSQPETENDDTPIKSKRRIPSTVEEESLLPSSPSAGYRGGRVRGIVESLERSTGSTGSDGSDEANVDQSFNEARMESELKAAGIWISSEPEENGDDTGDISSSSASDGEMVEEHHSRNSSLGSQPPAYSHATQISGSDEPTVAELLAQDASFDSPLKRHGPRDGTFEEAPSWGAMMWEKDSVVGGTAKKVVPADVPKPIRPGVVQGAPQPNILNMFGEDELTKELESRSAPVADQAEEMLEAFRVRLEAMEMRLKELEMRDERREKELMKLREKEREKARERVEAERSRQSQARKRKIDLTLDPDPYATIFDEDSDPVDIPWPRPVRPVVKTNGTSIITPLVASTEKKKVTIQEPERVKDESIKADDDPPLEVAPSELSELPAYVLLVTMGVAAVVTRLLFRRMGGGIRP